MRKILCLLKKELMLTISVLMACLSLFLSKPGVETLRSIDWHTLAILFMMLTVLEGFKKENIFQPVLRFSEKITSMVGISFFLIFGVFFSSMFVTNDVSLIVFVPLTILLFRTAKKRTVYSSGHLNGKYSGDPRFLADPFWQSAEPVSV